MSTVRLSVHGHVSLTLRNASAKDVRAVTQAIGASRDVNTPGDNGRAVRGTDVEICFSKRGRDITGWRKLGEQGDYWTEGRLAICDSRTTGPIEVELPAIENSEMTFRIHYPTGLRRLPLLRSIVNAISAEKQVLGVHGTAFTYEDRGYLVCGWPRGGKTGTLLAYLLQGAQYLAAEWAYVSHDGQMMHGVPEDIRLRDWHVRQSGGRLKRVGIGDRTKLASRNYASKGLFGASRLLSGTVPKGSKSLRILAEGIARRRYIDRPASEWLGVPLRARAAPLHTIFFVGTHRAPRIEVKLLGADEATRRLEVLQQEDLTDLLQTYRKWKYAISDPSDWLDANQANRNALIKQLVDGKTVYSVDHPSNVNLDDLFHQIQSSAGNLCSLSH